MPLLTITMILLQPVRLAFYLSSAEWLEENTTKGMIGYELRRASSRNELMNEKGMFCLQQGPLGRPNRHLNILSFR